jgi:hypothetical protein
MIRPGEIQKKANQLKVRDGQIEKDYIISWILFGISRNQGICMTYGILLSMKR